MIVSRLSGRDFLKPLNTRATRLGDLLPWLDFVAPGVVLHTDHALESTIALTGPDLRSQPKEVHATATMQLNNVLCNFGSGWTFHSITERFRSPTAEVPKHWGHWVAREVALEQSRRHARQPLLESRHTVTMTYKPALEQLERIIQRLSRDGRARDRHHPWKAYLSTFQSSVQRLALLMGGVMTEVEVLDDQALWNFFDSVTNLRWRHLPLPEDTHWMAQQMDDDPDDFNGGSEPIRHGRHIRAVSLWNFPRTSVSLMLAKLNDLDIQYVFSERWVPKDSGRMERTLQRKQEREFFHQKATWRRLLDRFFGEDAGGEKPMAQQNADAIKEAQILLGSERGLFGHLTVVVYVWGESAEDATHQINAVAGTFQSLGFKAEPEKTNTTQAYLSAFPGVTAPNPRKVLLHTINVSHLMQVDAVYCGEHWDHKWKCGPLLIGRTARSNPYRLVFDVDGVQHTFFDGPTGCHAKGTKILMADGSLKNVEDIVIGDQVMGHDSLPRHVLRLHQGTDEMVRVVPVKGEPFEVNMGHILSLKRGHDGTTLAGSVENISVRDWMKKSQTFRHTHQLYRVGVEFPVGLEHLPIHPYVLGVIIGDGSLTGNHPNISNPDMEIRTAIESLAEGEGFSVHRTKPNRSGCPKYSLCNTPSSKLRRLVTMTMPSGHLFTAARKVNPVVEWLKALGLYGRSSHEKFIPHIYKTSSKDRRLDMLAGLLDTDGYFGNGCYDLVSASQTLALDVVFLARSLGLAAYVRPCVKSCQNDFSGTYWRVSISGNVEIIPCRVQRKQCPPRRQKKSTQVTGFSVEPIGRGEYFGFECDGDHLYVMGDFTVTHNSGKTFFKDVFRTMCQQIPDFQDFGFDVKASSMTTTYCLNGTFIDLGTSGPILQPYRDVHRPEELEWAIEWTLRWLKDLNVTVDPYLYNMIRGTLIKLANLDWTLRTITGFNAALNRAHDRESVRLHKVDEEKLALLEQRRNEIRLALRPFEGGVLDGIEPHEKLDRITTFELETLLGRQTICRPVLRRVDHRIDLSLDGTPTLIWTDELQALLDLDESVDVLDARLRRTRDKNAMMLAGTQNLEDVLTHPLGPVFMKNCANFLFFPNAAALTQVKSYEAFGLTHGQMVELASARRQAMWLHKSARGTRMVEYRGDDLAIAVCGRSGPNWHRKVREVMAAVGPEQFPKQWLIAMEVYRDEMDRVDEPVGAVAD